MIWQSRLSPIRVWLGCLVRQPPQLLLAFEAGTASEGAARLATSPCRRIRLRPDGIGSAKEALEVTRSTSSCPFVEAALATWPEGVAKPWWRIVFGSRRHLVLQQRTTEFVARYRRPEKD